MALLACLWHMLVLQLPKTSFNPKLLKVTGITPLENWRGLSTAFRRKFKKRSFLPLVEQWEQYVTPNHSRFPVIDEEDFPAGTRVVAILNRIGSHYLKTEIRHDARRFLDNFVDCLLFTNDSRSIAGQELSCFCPKVWLVAMKIVVCSFSTDC